MCEQLNASFNFYCLKLFSNFFFKNSVQSTQLSKVSLLISKEMLGLHCAYALTCGD